MGKPLTEKRLYNAAVAYLARFDAARAQVRAVLCRKLKRAEQRGETVPQQAEEWIERALDRLEEQNYINEERTAENKVRLLSAQGKSAYFIRQKLAREGLDADLVESLLVEAPETEAQRAAHLLKKNGGGDYRKALARLARAGFSYETAQEALAQAGYPSSK